MDFLSLSAHKFFGPPGFGLLFNRVAGSLAEPLVYGGAQHGGLRPVFSRDTKKPSSYVRQIARTLRRARAGHARVNGTVAVGGAVALANALEDANGDARRLAERLAHLAVLADKVRTGLYDLSVAGLVLFTACHRMFLL